MRIAIKTLGCKSNRFESDRIFEELNGNCEVFELNEGVQNSFAGRFSQGEADLLIVNTCTVTHTADRKSRQAIRSFKRGNPECKVIAFGCGVNVSRGSYEKIEEVDFLAKDTDEVLEIAKGLQGEEFESCEYEGAVEDLKGHGMRTRALLKIQDGCDSYCTYCIIPTARGPEFSFDSKKLLAEAQRRESEGVGEIVLTGINIGEWKEDGMDLADLFEMLIDGTEKVRFRVSSIEPKNFSPKFFELFKTGRLCPHLHMSLQSGCDTVLKRMRRQYDTALYYEVCDRLREAVEDIALTTDIIVGFPGETEEEFLETCEFARRAGFMKIHVFPYSKRKNTAAWHMKDHVSEEVKKDRAQRLREVSEELSADFRERWLGREYDVVVEGSKDGFCTGYTENYIPVEFEGECELRSVVRVKLEELAGNRVKAVKI